jgi:hypothetical protein
MSFLRRAILLVSILILVLERPQIEASEEAALQGPILVSQFGQQITFQDMGSGRVWSLEVEMYTHFVSWSPDGCKLLLIERSTSNSQWILLTVNDLELDTLLPQTKSPIWHPDGQSLTYINYSNDRQITSVYSLDLLNQEVTFLFEVEEIGTPIQWLSENELLYDEDGHRFVWNAATRQNRAFGSEHYPPYAKPEETISRAFYRTDDISPSQELLVGFYDVASYRNALDPRTYDHELTAAERQEIETRRPETPGFDLYFLNAGTSRHVDVNGYFVESVVWSPSSQMIAVTTDTEAEDYGIYIYNIETDTIERIADAYNDLWFVRYLPAWSPNEEWVAYKPPASYVVQRLSDGEQTLLDPELKGDRVYWSPIMNYNDLRCDT